MDTRSLFGVWALAVMVVGHAAAEERSTTTVNHIRGGAHGVVTSSVVYETVVTGLPDFASAKAVAVDKRGNAYVAGAFQSPDFPNHPDAYVAKLRADGTLAYVTFIGGVSGGEEAVALDVDDQGNVYMTGSTSSIDFPVRNAAQPANGGGLSLDAFVAKLNPRGGDIIYGTYLGGAGSDNGWDIAVNARGEAHVVGLTESADFPTARSATVLQGFQDGFVTVVSRSGRSFVTSRFLGGTEVEAATGIAIDNAGRIHVVGSTVSPDFPLRRPMQATIAGVFDHFLTVFDARLRIQFSTLFGSSGNEQFPVVAVDGKGRTYIAGTTDGSDLPLRNAVQETPAGGADFFVARIDTKRRALLFSTYMGGSGDEWDPEIAVDRDGAVHLGGTTYSFDYPLVNPLLNGQSGVLVTKLSPAGSAVRYSTRLPLLPGEETHLPGPNGLDVDRAGNAYVGGSVRGVAVVKIASRMR